MFLFPTAFTLHYCQTRTGALQNMELDHTSDGSELRRCSRLHLFRIKHALSSILSSPLIFGRSKVKVPESATCLAKYPHRQKNVIEISS